jgi:hypothetical protein
MRYEGLRQNRDYPVLSIFGGEARLFVALAFIPDPEEPVMAKEIAEILGRDIPPVLQASYQLEASGLVSISKVRKPNPKEITRTSNPLWAIYEAAKVTLAEMGIESPSIRTD